MTPFTAALLAAIQIAQAGGVFPDRAASQLDSLRGGTTPSAWLASHSGDALLLFRRDSIRENHESWCARASLVERLVDGTRLVRFAYFYPPPPAPSLSLPAVGGATMIQDQCVLGTVWIETQVADSAAGAALATSVRETLTRAHGPVRAGPDVFFGRTPTDSQRRLLSRLPGADAMFLGIHFSGAAGWRVPGRWQVDSTVIVSAFDRGLGNRPGGGRVVAFAYLPIAQLGSFRAQSERERVAKRRTAALAQDAARLAGFDRVRTDRLTDLLAAAESAYTGRHAANPRAIDSSAVITLADWISSARRLAPPQRAAALLAADQVAGSQAMIYVRAQRQDSGRLALARLGAVFARNELGGGYNYTHNWLDEALQLDRTGPVGTLATVALLRIGFNETGMCGGGSEAFRQVIATGEQLLAGHLDTVTTAEVHRLVGDAYADIVALATGDGAGYADSPAYLAEAPAARSSAIGHYRKALALERTSPEARTAWLEAWRLLAGLPPTTTHYFCVYD